MDLLQPLQHLLFLAAYMPGEDKQRNDVRNNKEEVERIGQLPNQVDLHHRSDQYDGYHHEAVGPHQPFAEKVAHVLRGKEVPPHDGAESKEEEGDGNEIFRSYKVVPARPRQSS